MTTTNLVNGKAKVWFPPNKKAGEALDITWEVLMGFFRSSSSRQKRLDPKNTQVSNKGKIYIKGSGLKLTEEQARQRGGYYLVEWVWQYIGLP